ncbi:hypothetical protein Tco_1005697 [Tanacetum coccineum]|uniref:Uncharacterized protein n=1 Tax=Tanacetum coccineum TaxID=301880 RepID=A0ABQ5FGP4_9ASTR
MVEPEKPLKKKDQIILDEELALRLQAKNKQSWKKKDYVDADEQLAVRLQAEEQEQFSIEEKSRMLVEMIAEKKSSLWHKEQQSKEEGVMKKFRSSLIKHTNRAGDELEYDKSKKQKIDEHVEAEKDDQEEAKMKRHIDIVKDDEVAIDSIPLATKPLMLQDIDREDLETLWKLVKARHRNTRPEEDYERVLWSDLKTHDEQPYQYPPFFKIMHIPLKLHKVSSSSSLNNLFNSTQSSLSLSLVGSVELNLS